MSGSIHLDRHGPHVALIRIDRPEARNALTPRMLCALADAFLAVRDDAEVRAVVLTGTGDVAFCAGGDLGLTLPLMTGARAPQDECDRRLLDDPRTLAASSLRGFDIVKPTICAINGTCLAAGFELMLGTDIRIAADTARFAESFVRVGIVPGDGGAWLLPRAVGLARASEMAFTGEPIDAREALACGLVSRVVAIDELLPLAR